VSPFSLSQSDNDSGTVSTTGNDISGDYTATAIGADTVATTQGYGGETITSTHTDSSTLTNTGNDYTGDFTTTGTEVLGTTVDESYTYSNYGLGTYSTYSFHEGSSDSPNITITGNDIDGTQTSTQIGDESYSVSDGWSSDPSDPFAFSENGDKSYTLVSSEDANTGDTTSTETGTDNYTLTQGGFGGLGEWADINVEYPLFYTLTVTGSEDYGITITSNSQSGDFSQTYTGGGDYSATGDTTYYNSGSTLTQGYSTSSSTSYDDTETGDTRDGGVTLTQSGTDRYQTVPSSNVNPGDSETTSWRGDYEYSPVGLPFQVTRASVPAGIFSSIGDDRYDYCFAAGTLVLMADGSRKPIEKIEAGEMVLAVPDTDPEAEPRACRVLEVYHNAPARLLAVRIAGQGDVSGGDAVFTTAEHPFYVGGRGWTKAEDLRAGDRLRTWEGAWVRVRSIQSTGRTEPVFNLRVTTGRTYFVGRLDGALVLVHNDSSGTATQFVTVDKGNGVTASLTTEQLKAFRAASAIIGLRAKKADADAAVMSWLNDNPGTALDAPPSQRVPANLMAAMNTADQAVDDAEGTYNQQYGNVDTRFSYFGGDVINFAGGGKGLGAAVKAVKTLGRVGPDPGLSSDITPILIAVTPAVGPLTAAGASAEAVPEAVAATARSSLSAIEDEVAQNVGKMLDDASIKAAREYAAANPGATPRVFEAVYDPATGEVTVGRSGLVPPRPLPNVTGAQSSVLKLPWQACALPKAANDAIMAAGEDGGLFGSNGGFKVVDGELYFQPQCKNCELFYPANPALTPAAPMFDVPAGTPAFPVAGPRP